MSDKSREFMIGRRQMLGAAAAGVATLGLAACGGEPAPAPAGSADDAAKDQEPVALDAGSGGAEHLTATDHELTGFVTHKGSFPFHW